MALQVGDKAPGFTLYNSNKTKVSLADYNGKNVLLLFFPLAFSSVCTAELCSVRDNFAAYNQANAEVFGISVDSLFVLSKFEEDQHLNFQLLSDFNKEASESYGVLYDTFPAFEMKGVSKRAAFVVDGEGKLSHIEICDSPGDQPNFEAIMAALKTLD